MTKEALRKIYKEKRNGISIKDNERWTDLILINFQKLDLPFIKCVHTYLPIENQNEVDTENIIRYLNFKNPGLIVVVPKINLSAGEMKHYIFNDDVEMAVNSFGIVEPVMGKNIMADEIDLVLTPLLAFDKCGNRVGYGKGFYDKFFPQCNKNVIRVGLSFFEAEERIDDINPFDMPLHYCITPQLVHTF
ncbi:MAG TPA: 5-formyltetrahydrofolate cyclo-ligase [Chitinophagaceae bacterium]|nr:5-formyltetrahydrofolate cyclo-ligase [Chitinophagaceae bacterium]